MWSRFPPNFEEHWEGANVILRTQNSNGKELHANKETLAANSSYFNAMFFSGFKEAYQDYVDVPCDYKRMLKILKTIHTKNCYFRDDLLTIDGLMEMHRVADMFDFPLIKKMCDEKRKESLTSAARFAVKFGDHDTFMEILLKMTSSELLYFLNFKDNYPLFSKKDVARIYMKITDELVPKGNAEGNKKKNAVVEEMKSIPTGINDKMIDLTKKLYASDVAISTRNSGGKLLYSKKEVLASLSPYFHKILFTNKDSFTSIDGCSFVTLDVEFITMKMILVIIHTLNPDSSPKHFIKFHPILLYEMCRVAEVLEISLIEKMCVDKLLEQATVQSLEIAIKLDQPDLISQLVGKMYPSDLCDWVRSEDEKLIYWNANDEMITISSKAADPTLSLNDLRVLIWRLHSKFRPPCKNFSNKFVSSFPTSFGTVPFPLSEWKSSPSSFVTVPFPLSEWITSSPTSFGTVPFPLSQSIEEERW